MRVKHKNVVSAAVKEKSTLGIVLKGQSIPNWCLVYLIMRNVTQSDHVKCFHGPNTLFVVSGCVKCNKMIR